MRGLEDLKILFKRKGDFKEAFQWYLPVSIKFAIAEIAKKMDVHENQLVEKYLREGLKKDSPAARGHRPKQQSGAGGPKEF